MSICFDFSGKKAIVTGASIGIGRDIVRALAVANISKVYAVARSRDLLEELKKEYPCVTPVVLDQRDWEATRVVVGAIEPVDYLVNNAGCIEEYALSTHIDFTKANLEIDSKPNRDNKLKADDVDIMNNLTVRSVNSVSPIVCLKMVRKGGGAVVNMSSMHSMTYLENRIGYCVSKHSLDAVTKHMAINLAPTVRVNSVIPSVDPKVEGYVNPSLMGRSATLQEISNAVLFLLSDGASMCVGQNLHVDGGLQQINE